MKSKLLLLLFIFSATFTWSITHNYSFRCLTKVVRHGQVFHENRLHSYSFNVNIISDSYGYKKESHYYRHPFILARQGERYRVKIHNPLPVRVAVNLMIDGLNSISGAAASVDNGAKWLIAPFSSITISGWQVSQQSLRRFYFTTRSDSYASWRSHYLGRNLRVRCGIISASYFWSRSELQNYFEQHPIYEGIDSPRRPRYFGKDRQAAAIPKKPTIWHNEQAGTGMGERRQHGVEYVDFHYDMGMYTQASSVKIYYDFRYPFYHQRPYPYQKFGGFAPEKPNYR